MEISIGLGFREKFGGKVWEVVWGIFQGIVWEKFGEVDPVQPR